MTTAAASKLIITLKLVKDAARACTDCARADWEAEEQHKAKEQALMALFEPLLGIKTREELSELSPERVASLALRRLRQRKVELSGITRNQLLDAIQKTQARRHIQWKEEFVRALGESRAAEITQHAPEHYSYKVVVPACL